MGATAATRGEHSSRTRHSRIARLRHPLAIVLIAGLVVRLAAMVLAPTAVYNYFGGDSARYLRLESTGYTGLFDDPGMTAGYPAFLHALQWISSQLAFTIAVQHLLGLVTAALLYATLRRAGTPLGLALVPAAVVALGGDFVYLEHALLTEPLWTALLTGSLYCVVRALGERVPWRWLAAGGALLALSATVRSPALLLPVVLVPWVLLAFGPGPRRRLLAAAALLVPFAVLVGAYAGAARIADGYAGFTDLSGFNQYGRVGQFADCRRFTPPAGTEQLCETTPVAERPGPFFYQWSPDSPMRKAGMFNRPEDAEVMGRFARAALVAQPLDMAKVVAKDVLRFIVPEAGVDRPWSGSGPDRMSFGWTAPVQQSESREQIAAGYATDYDGVAQAMPGTGALSVLETYQGIFRVPAIAIVAALVLSAAAIALVPGLVRWVTLLLVGVTVYIWLVSAGLNSYEVRYGVTAASLLMGGAALSAWGLVQRRRSKATRP